MKVKLKLLLVIYVSLFVAVNYFYIFWCALGQKRGCFEAAKKLSTYPYCNISDLLTVCDPNFDVINILWRERKREREGEEAVEEEGERGGDGERGVMHVMTNQFSSVQKVASILIHTHILDRARG
jgi:hypothetical protein